MMSFVIDRSLKGNPLAPFLFSCPDIGYKKCAVNPEVVLQSTLQYVGVFTVRIILAYRNRSLLRNLRKTRRQKARLQRMRQRLLRKLQKSKSRKTKGKKKIADSECSPDERLNCFSHDNDHWKTAPFWSDGPFCACTGSNTNTYSCVRNVNATHNYLYCEFVSGLITYYNLNVDPFQLRNIYLTLSTEELNFMHHQLAVLKNQGLAYSRNYGNRAVARQRSFIQRYGTYSNTSLKSP